jgi:integrase
MARDVRPGWSGTNPVSVMLTSERPKPSQSSVAESFEGAELEQTISAAQEPWRTLFTLAALTGERVSELLALTWANVRLDALDDAEIEFAWQVDRRGERGPTKTDGSAGTVPIPRSSRWYSHNTGLRRRSSSRTTSCSPHVREDRCASGTSGEHCESRSATL